MRIANYGRGSFKMVCITIINLAWGLVSIPGVVDCGCTIRFCGCKYPSSFLRILLVHITAPHSITPFAAYIDWVYN